MNAWIPLLACLFAPCLHAAPGPTRELRAAIEELLADECAAEGAGVVVVVAHAGKPWLEMSRGMANIAEKQPFTADHMVDLASVSKAFTACAILRLAADGKLDLADPVGKHLPELDRPELSGLTLDHLVHMSSGLPDYTGDVEDFQETTPAEVRKQIAAYPLEFAPGSAYEYSNTNYFLLGQVVENVAGQRLDTWLASRVFEPLGMRSSQLLTAPGPLDPRRAVPYRKKRGRWEKCLNDTRLYGDGQVLSTARDLVAWCDAWRGERLLPAPFVARAFAPYRLAGGKDSDYAAGWVREEWSEHDAVSHGGSWDGTSTHVLHLLDAPIDVITLSNDEEVDTDGLAESVLEEVLEVLEPPAE